jgi:ABC-type multidrug transport system fused ATPase/permease subunit
VSNKSRRSTTPKAAKASASGPRAAQQGPHRRPSRQGAPQGGRARGAASGGGFRPALERRSARWLVLLHQMPRFLVPVLMGLLLLVGLVATGSWAPLGAALLVLVALFILWLTALSWPILQPAGRIARVLVIASLLGVAVLKLQGNI